MIYIESNSYSLAVSRGFLFSGDVMEKKEDKPIAIGAESVPFKFELSQLVTMRISEEWEKFKPVLSMQMAKTSI